MIAQANFKCGHIALNKLEAPVTVAKKAQISTHLFIKFAF